MGIKHLIAGGIGFAPGGPKYIVTRGLLPGEAVSIDGPGLEITPRPNRLHWRAVERKADWTADLNRAHWRAHGA